MVKIPGGGRPVFARDGGEGLIPCVVGGRRAAPSHGKNNQCLPNVARGSLMLGGESLRKVEIDARAESP